MGGRTDGRPSDGCLTAVGRSDGRRTAVGRPSDGHRTDGKFPEGRPDGKYSVGRTEKFWTENFGRSKEKKNENIRDEGSLPKKKKEKTRKKKLAKKNRSLLYVCLFCLRGCFLDFAEADLAQISTCKYSARNRCPSLRLVPDKRPPPPYESG